MAPESILINPSDLTPAFGVLLLRESDILKLKRAHHWDDLLHKHATIKSGSDLTYIRVDVDSESTPGQPEFPEVPEKILNQASEIYLVFRDDSNFAIRSNFEGGKTRVLPPLVLKDLKRLTSYKSV